MKTERQKNRAKKLIEVYNRGIFQITYYINILGQKKRINSNVYSISDNQILEI